MRKLIIAVAALALAAMPASGAVPDLSTLRGSTSVVVDLGSDVITSDNVTYHGTIPLDAPGVGGEVVVREDLGGTTFFYATGLKGLSIEDIRSWPDRIRAVTAEQVRTVAQKWLEKKRSVTGYLIKDTSAAKREEKRS